MHLRKQLKQEGRHKRGRLQYQRKGKSENNFLVEGQCSFSRRGGLAEEDAVTESEKDAKSRQQHGLHVWEDAQGQIDKPEQLIADRQTRPQQYTHDHCADRQGNTEGLL